MLSATALPRLPLSALQRQRLDGWVRMLDVDLDLAQRVLAGDVRCLPVPPLALPAVTTPGWDGSPIVLVPAVPAPDVSEPVVLPPGSPQLSVVGGRLVGAYARRAGRTT
jgi:hypothetical protein